MYLNKLANKKAADAVSGTTAAVVAVHGSELVTANLGDSRAIVVAETGANGLLERY